MGLYDEFFELIKSKFPRTNEGMTGGLAAELLLIISLIILCLLFRHINVLLSVVLVIVLAIIVLTNMPISQKFAKEQDDSLDKMMFYVIVALGIIVVFLYWGARYV